MSLEALSGARSRDKIVLKTFELFPFGLQNKVFELFNLVTVVCSVVISIRATAKT